MPNTVTIQASDSTQEQIDATLKDIAKRKEKHKKIISSMKAAKKGLTNVLKSSSDVLDKVSDELGADYETKIKDASDYLKKANTFLEKTSVIIGLIKGAKTMFWLALVQVLVEEAKSSLKKQKEYIIKMLDIVQKFRALVENIAGLLEGITDTKALEFAYDQAVAAAKELERIKEMFITAKRLRALPRCSAANYLASAQRRLENDLDKFAEIPSKTQFAELNKFIVTMYPMLHALLTDYLTEYALYITLIQSIYLIKKNVLKQKHLLDTITTAALVNKIKMSLEREVVVPMEKMQDRWKKRTPTTNSIVWNEFKYSNLIKYHKNRIESFFDNNFENLATLDIAKTEYKTLVTNLRADLYSNGEIEQGKPDEVMKENITKFGALDIFKLVEKPANLISAVIDKIEGTLNNIITKNIERSYTILAHYGPYQSALLGIVEGALRTFGYDKPLQKFATGDLINISSVSGKLAEIQKVTPQGTITTSQTVAGIGLLGVVAGTTTKEDIKNIASSTAKKYEDLKKKVELRRQQRKWQHELDTAIEEENEKKKYLDDLERTLKAQRDGKFPESWEPDLVGEIV